MERLNSREHPLTKEEICCLCFVAEFLSWVLFFRIVFWSTCQYDDDDDEEKGKGETSADGGAKAKKKKKKKKKAAEEAAGQVTSREKTGSGPQSTDRSIIRWFTS